MNRQPDICDGVEFEKRICELINALPEYSCRQTRTTGDFGLDLIVRIRGVKIGIQCKCWKNAVGIKAVQEAATGKLFHECKYAVVVSASKYTHAAKDLARKTGVVLVTEQDLIECLEGIKLSEQPTKEEIARRDKIRIRQKYLDEMEPDEWFRYVLGDHKVPDWLASDPCWSRDTDA